MHTYQSLYNNKKTTLKNPFDWCSDGLQPRQPHRLISGLLTNSDTTQSANPHKSPKRNNTVAFMDLIQLCVLSAPQEICDSAKSTGQSDTFRRWQGRNTAREQSKASWTVIVQTAWCDLHENRRLESLNNNAGINTFRPSTAHISTHLPIHPSIRPSIRPSIHPSICLSIYLSIYLSIHLSICLWVTRWLNWLSVGL